MNKCVFIGRLTNDPTLRYTTDGKAISNFTLAVNRDFSKDKEADFFRVVAWNKTAELVSKYLKKGLLVAVDGRMQTGSYEKDGIKHYKTDLVADRVEFLEWDNDKNEQKKEKKEEDIYGGFKAVSDDEEAPF